MMAAAEWVLAVYLGSAHTISAPLLLTQPQAGNDLRLAWVDYRGESMTPPLYYGYRVSLFPQASSWIGVEGEFIHLKVYANTDRTTRMSGTLRAEAVDGMLPIRSVVERFSISHGLNLVVLNVVVRRTLHGRRDGRGEVELFGRAGIGPTLPHAESTIDHVSREGYALGSPALQTATGLEIRVSKRLTVLAEYKLSRTRQTVDVDRGEMRGSFVSHHVVVGIARHFR
jgi:hypothetical protein